MNKKRKERLIELQIIRRGIPRRIEELGLLNDEYLRLCAEQMLDKNGFLKLAKRYQDRGMKAMANKILKEACLNEDVL